MKTIKLTMAQALVKFLNQQYVDVDGTEQKYVHGMLGIFGHGNAVGLGQALEQYKDEITYIPGKNEQEIAHVGVAYAKQMRRRAIYACTASIGPGALNMVTAAGTASVNRIPILLLPSDTYADRQPDPVLQQLEHEYDYTITVNDSFKAVSKYFDRVVRPEQLMTAMLNAFRVLTDPEKTGAVTVCLPQDVQGQSYDYPEEFFKKRVWIIERRMPTPVSIEKAASLFAGAKKPIIVSGGGTRYSDAGKAVEAFSNKFGIPVCETQAGKGEISCEAPTYLGCGGICGTLAANVVAKKADLVIMVGTKLNDFVTNSKAGYAPNAKFVSINVSRMDTFKFDACSVVADAREGIDALSAKLEGVGYKAAWGNEVVEAKAAWNAECDRLRNLEPGKILHQTRVLMDLNKWLKDDNIVSASGSLPSDLERVWTVNRPGAYHLEYGFSCMGYEISAALGVRMAEPQHEVYAFVGDGGFMMGHSDLYTSIQERKKINVLLFNNSGHQCIHNLEVNNGMDMFGTEFRYRENESGCPDGDLIDVNYSILASAYGCKTWRVHTLEELKVAIDESKKSEVSTLIEIMVAAGTCTEGYECFWRVGTAEVAEKESVLKARHEIDNVVNSLLPY